MKRIAEITFIALALLWVQIGYAQKKEQTAVFAEFMQVCNAYKTLPLYLSLSYKAYSNMQPRDADTVNQSGHFYITEAAAYIQFANLEQCITDTQVLVVMNDIKQMVVYQNSRRITEQMNAMLGKPAAANTIEELQENYIVTKAQQSKNTHIITIQSKKTVYADLAAVTTVTLEYDPVVVLPKKVVTIKRGLYKISDPSAINANVKVIDIPEKGRFAVTETTTCFTYNKIENKQNILVPVQIKDRVIKQEGGSFIPAAGYSEYMITEN